MSPDQIVYCVYTKEGKCIKEILTESFSVFLRQQIEIVAKRPVNHV